MIELKPCPFCGSKPDATYIKNAIGVKTLNIECNNSKCGIVLFTKLTFTKDEQIIEAWNRRADGAAEKHRAADRMQTAHQKQSTASAHGAKRMPAQVRRSE